MPGISATQHRHRSWPVTRVRSHDWIRAGLGLLSEEGEHALTLERLCADMRKTRGSFYHHFSDMNAFIGAMLDQWTEDQTHMPIRRADEERDAFARMKRLDRVVAGLDHKLDQIIRAWSIRDPRAKRAIDRVDKLRVSYIALLYGGFGLNGDDAERLAELEYTLFLGAQQKFELMTGVEALRSLRLFREMAIQWIKQRGGELPNELI